MCGECNWPIKKEDKMEWISVKDKPAPKNQKFLFSYYFGIGLGEWGQCYSIINGNSERIHEAYIMILWPSEVVEGCDPFEWDEKFMIELDIYWMPLPYAPKE